MDIEIFLDFQPEKFNLNTFQDTGRYLGWKGDHATILDAPMENVRALARNYWVAGITRVKAGES